MDMTASIIPKSDQLNADDLISGPVTVTIEHTTAGNAEQPFDFHLIEFPGRAYRPSKSMRRVLVTAWGNETDNYTGRRLTLYRDPTIRFGKDEVGGIRISHMSHIDKAIKLALTVKRGQRDQFIVEPLKQSATVTDSAATEQTKTLIALMSELGISEKSDRLAYCVDVIGRPLASAGEMTSSDTAKVIEALTADKAAQDQTFFGGE